MFNIVKYCISKVVLMYKFVLSVLAGVSILSSSAFAMEYANEDYFDKITAKPLPALSLVTNDLFTQHLCQYLNPRDKGLFVLSNAEFKNHFVPLLPQFPQETITDEQWNAYTPEQKKSFNLTSARAISIALGVQEPNDPSKYFDAFIYQAKKFGTGPLCWVHAYDFAKGPLPKAPQLKDQMNRVDLRGMSLTGKKINGGKLIRVNATGADFSDAVFIGSDLSLSILQKTNMRNINLRNCNLTNADLSGSDLTNANLGKTNLTNTYLKDVILDGVTLRRAQFLQAVKTGANLRGVKVSKFEVRNHDFSGKNLRGLEAKDLCFKDCKFRDTNFSDAILTLCSFSRVRMDGAKFVNTHLNTPMLSVNQFTRDYETTFSNASMIAVDMTGSNLKGVNLSDANLTNANLHGSLLHSTNCTRANLTGANLTGATITGANFTGAQGLDASGAIGLDQAMGIKNSKMPESQSLEGKDIIEAWPLPPQDQSKHNPSPCPQCVIL